MASAKEVTTKFRLDLREFSANINKAQQEIKLANAEFKAASAGMDDWSKSSEGINAKIKQLTTILNAEKSKLEEYNKAQEKAVQKEQESAKAKEQLKKAIDAHEKELKDLIEAHGEESEEVEEAKKSLEELKKEYKLVSTVQRANAKEVDNLNLKIKNQEATVKKTEKEIDDYGETLEDVEKAEKKAAKSGKTVEEELKDLEKQTKQTGDGFTVFKGILADLGSQAITGALNGIKKLGGAVINLGKQAVGNYANAEQLIGGVETLFGTGGQSLEEYAKSVGKSVKQAEGEYNKLKKAQENVINDANNAYKTAGMSANEYMETVTSFSASLISSLDGDTEKAGKAANQAIIDMSDNANKMGTDLSSIQNAYQGFAKGQYNMLDNLKLGYGGTKTEMERLLADAEKLSGQKYDISNLNDVYEAIHVVQEEMGIAGTTAKEASETISGSAMAMKSAWQNLLTGLASGGDISGLITNFVDSVMTLADNLIPVVKNVASGLGDLISGLIKEFVPKLIKEIPPLLQQLLPDLVGAMGSLIEGVISALPDLLKVIMDIIPQITQSLLNMLPLLVEVGVELISSLLVGLGKMAPQIVIQIIEIIPKIIDALINAIPQLIAAALQFFMAIVEAIPDVIQALITALPQIIDTIITGLTNAIPQLIAGAIQLLNAIVEAIPIIIDTLIPEIPKIVSSLVTGLIENFPTLLQGGIDLFMALVEAIPTITLELIKAGPDIIKGLIQGISDAITNIDWGEVFGGILDGFKKLFGIHSPSTVMAEQGNYMTEGMLSGIKDMPKKALEIFEDLFKKVSAWGKNLAKKAIEIATKFVKFITNIVVELPQKIWNAIVGAVTKIAEWGSKIIAKGKEVITNFVSNVWNKAKEAPSKIWNAIVGAVSKVGEWGSNLLAKGKEAAQKLVTGIVEKVKELPNKIKDVGKNLVEGIWNGISNGYTWIKDKIKGWVGNVTKFIKKLFGISSPSKVMRDEVGKYLAQGIGVGFVEETDAVKKEINKALNGLTNHLDIPSINLSGASYVGAGASNSGTSTIINNNFYQTNNSPKPLDNLTIYRQTKNILNRAR